MYPTRPNASICDMRVSALVSNDILEIKTTVLFPSIAHFNESAHSNPLYFL